AQLALGQSTAADIVGIVRDATGAVVPNVLLRAVQEETNLTRETRSTAEGIYEFRILPPGVYTLTAEATGFKKYANEHIPLVSRQVLRIEIAMAVGSLAENVTVVAEAPVVTTDTGTLSETRGSRLLTEGPQGTYIQNIFGAYTGKYSVLVRETGLGAGTLKAGGSRGGQYETNVDGYSVDASNYSLPAMAIAEEKVTIIGAPAESRTPVTMDAVTRQGGNRFHGGVVFLLGHARLNALPADYPTSRRPAQLPFHQWNFTAGGPLYVPKLYDGRNRTFLFLSMERNPPTERSSAEGRVISVPTNGMRQGDFSAYYAATGRPTRAVTDPFSGQPFPGQAIPLSRFNPTAVKAINNFFPAPNVASANPNVPFNNYNGPIHNASSWSTLFVRLDQKITGHNTAGFDFNQNPLRNTISEPYPALGSSFRIGGSKLYSWRDTHVFSATIVNEVRIGYFNFDNERHGVVGSTLGGVADALGIDLGPDAATRRSYRQAPRIAITGFTYGDPGSLGSTYSDDAREQRWAHFRDNLSIQRGRHTFKTGYDHRFKQDSRLPASSAIGGSQTFSGRFSGDAWADFLIGLPEGTGRFSPSLPLFDRRYNELGVYLQDDFKATSRLTLNLGLRFDRISARTDANGAYDSFDLKTGAIVVPDEASIKLVHPAFPANIPKITAAQAGYPSTLINPSVAWTPRFGFAYRLTAKGDAVLRGSYSIFSVDAGISLNNFRIFDAGPFSLTETFLNTITNGVPLVTLNRPFPNQLGAGPSTISASGANPDLGTPKMQQYTLMLERTLLGKWVAKLGYVGTRNTQAWYVRDLNRPPASLTPYSASRSTYPIYRSVGWTDKGAGSWYNAMQAGLTHRFNSGLELDGLFQWISELNDVQDLAFRTNGNALDNPYCRSCDKGKSTVVDSLDFRANFLYELPVGRGKQFAPSLNRVVNGFAGGWSLSGIVDIRNGRPDSVFFSGRDASNTNLTTGRVDVVPGCNLHPSDGKSGPYLNIACFAIPQPGTFGNASTSLFRKPGSWDVSGAVYKYFPLFREDVKLRVNAVFTNLFNHPTWSTVGNNISTPATFGKLSGQGAPGRSAGPRSIVLQAAVQW
ncbi:MAG: TonB-dependent receptor, partial [Acidobacteria bacterium]|nr:TonB-dependent receptor [Acidobacteriota bacterium]